jgi:murein DD-endopeptidase MepM/ murein hydrolase activator NlpD
VGVVAVAALAGMAQTGTYTVKRGDTLTGIARRQHLSIAAITGANGITNPNRIFAGQVLVIPDAGGSASGPTVVVKPGDTLTKIANRTGVPLQTLIAANGLVSPYRIYAGGQLLLAPRTAGAFAPLQACPVAGARFMNDWGFPRANTGFHEGNDMMARRGTPIVAPVSGTVSFVTGSIGGKQFKLVGTDGTLYRGSHMDSFGTPGAVSAGDVIGTVGDTGDARGGPTHLHFEIHPGGGVAVNPYDALVQACR